MDGITKISSLEEDFRKALTLLDEILEEPFSVIVRDAAIQCFEIVFELCWKYLKVYLQEEHNTVCTSPRTCFKAVFKHGMIDDDPFWIELTDLPNYTVHTYNEPVAQYVYKHLPEAKKRFHTVLDAIAI